AFSEPVSQFGFVARTDLQWPPILSVLFDQPGTSLVAHSEITLSPTVQMVKVREAYQREGCPLLLPIFPGCGIQAMLGLDERGKEGFASRAAGIIHGASTSHGELLSKGNRKKGARACVPVLLDGKGKRIVPEGLLSAKARSILNRFGHMRGKNDVSPGQVCDSSGHFEQAQHLPWRQM